MSMNEKDSQALMKNLANDAVTFADSEFSVALDFSVDSILSIYQLIIKLREQFQSDLADEKTIYTLSNILGAYCGECFIKQHGGSWLIEDDGEKNMVYLQKGSFTFPFPGVVYFNMIDANSLPIHEYYREAVQQVSE